MYFLRCLHIYDMPACTVEDVGNRNLPLTEIHEYAEKTHCALDNPQHG